jgi:hypothetical protein
LDEGSHTRHNEPIPQLGDRVETEIDVCDALPWRHDNGLRQINIVAIGSRCLVHIRYSNPRDAKEVPRQPISEEKTAGVEAVHLTPTA